MSPCSRKAAGEEHGRWISAPVLTIPPLLVPKRQVLLMFLLTFSMTWETDGSSGSSGSAAAEAEGPRQVELQSQSDRRRFHSPAISVRDSLCKENTTHTWPLECTLERKTAQRRR